MWPENRLEDNDSNAESSEIICIQCQEQLKAKVALLYVTLKENTQQVTSEEKRWLVRQFDSMHTR